MKRRLEALLGADVPDLWVGTFHAVCARLLRRIHEAAGLERNFVIYDDADQRAVMNRVLKELELDDRSATRRARCSRASTARSRRGAGPTEFVPGRLLDDRPRSASSSTSGTCARRTRRLRRPAPPRRCALAERRSPSARTLAPPLPLRARRRVPGREPGAVPARARPRRASTTTSASSATTTRASTAGAAPTSASSAASSATSRRHGREARAELPLDERDRRGRARRHPPTTASASRRSSGPSRRRASPCASSRPRTSTTRRAFVVAERGVTRSRRVSPREIAVFYRMHAQSRVLEEVLRGRRSPTRSSAARASSSAPR